MLKGENDLRCMCTREENGDGVRCTRKPHRTCFLLLSGYCRRALAIVLSITDTCISVLESSTKRKATNVVIDLPASTWLIVRGEESVTCLLSTISISVLRVQHLSTSRERERKKRAFTFLFFLFDSRANSSLLCLPNWHGDRK